jgi:hypothetical protein
MNQKNLVDKLLNVTNLISKYNRTSRASYIPISKMLRRFERMQMINKIFND